MITCETTQSIIGQRDIATCFYTCIIFIGTGLGLFLPIIFMSTLILLISICAFTALVQLILLNKK